MTRVDLAQADAERFRETLAKLDIDVLLDSTLRTIPGSLHLHLRPRSERRGVLEYTLDPVANAAWLSWHAKRHQPWIEALAAALVAFEGDLG